MQRARKCITSWLCECNFAPYPKGMWHITHSMCKSITGMAVGLLIQEGKLRLDENIYDIFPDKVNSLLKIFRPVITVENLLTMSSGITFNESGIVSGNDWVASYLNSTVNGTTGQIFQYNSMNTYMLSAIVTKRTGETLTEYLKPRLFLGNLSCRDHKGRLGAFPLCRGYGQAWTALSPEGEMEGRTDHSGKLGGGFHPKALGNS